MKKINVKVPETFEEFRTHMTTKRINEIETKTSNKFAKLTAKFHDEQLKFQELQKEFVSTPKSNIEKRNELKSKLIDQYKEVLAAEEMFNSALKREDADLYDEFSTM